jgi:hypothetical protein
MKTATQTAEFVLCVVGGLWRPNADNSIPGRIALPSRIGLQFDLGEIDAVETFS